MNAKGILLLLLFAGAAHCVAAQDEDGDTGVPPMALYVQVGKTLYKGDSIPDIVTPTLYKYPPIKFKSKRDEAKYNRLVNNVKRAEAMAARGMSPCSSCGSSCAHAGGQAQNQTGN